MIMDIKLRWDSKEKGAFVIDEAEGRTAALVFGISEGRMTVYHTEVAEKHKGQGVAGELFACMADYARKHKLQVFPRCAYVHAQFKRHPEEYADIWDQEV
jgi:uncharacterized protein